MAAIAHVRSSTWTELGRTVTVVMSGLREWAATAGNDANQLRLCLAGRVIPDLEPSLIVRSQEYLNFELKIRDRNLLVVILSAARQARHHAIPISLALWDSKQPFDSKQYIILNVYPTWTPWLVVGMVALVAGLFFLGRRSEILRDSVLGKPAKGRAAYSLARVQMAVWFAVVVGSYLYIWLITTEYNAPTASVLALLGISAATGLSAVFVDREKVTALANRRAALAAEQAALNARIASLSAASLTLGAELHKEVQERSFRLNQVTADLAALPAAPSAPISKGFMRDVLGDGDGMSLPRVQIGVWTVVLVTIFVRSVYRDLAMPDFDAALLGLMGISSGTYLGFKFPEKPK